MAPAKISSTALLIQAARRTTNVYIRVFALGWSRLILLHLLQAGVSQFFGYATELLRQMGREDLMIIALLALSELAFTLLWSAAWVLAVSEIADSIVGGHSKVRSSRAFFLTFNQIVIEQVRALASILWRTPLLVIPAVIQYVRLTFVPFVVMFDRAYDRGRVDALKQSQVLSRGHFTLLTIVIFAGLLLPWFAEESVRGDNGRWVWENPMGVSFGWTLTLFINALTSIFLFALFRGIYTPAQENSPAPEAV